MSFGQFLFELYNSGTGGVIAVTIIFLAIAFWCFSMFMLPFRISHIREDVTEIRDDVEKLSRKDGKP